MHAEMPSFQRQDDAAPLRAIFVERLVRLIGMRRKYDADLNSAGAKLIDRAIYATYQDCIDHGAAEEALALLTARKGARP